MSNNTRDAVGPLKSVNMWMISILGSLTLAYKGTEIWNILNNLGIKRTLTIPSTYIIKGLPMRLLSPKHLAQLDKKTDHKDKPTV